MSKILFIGDPHLKITNLDQSIQFLRWVESIASQYKPDLVVNLGDTFHNHAVLRSELLSEFHTHIQNIQQQYIYILGNHDMYKPDSAKYHALSTFNLSNLKLITSPTDIEDISFVPYVPDYKDFPTNLKPITVAHQTFVGCDYGGYKPEYGVDADTLNTDIIISGHIHMRQQFGKVIYPGTPFAQGVNDIDQSKGLLLFDTATFHQEYLESPFPKWKSLRYDDTPSIDDFHDSLCKNLLSTEDHYVIYITTSKSEFTTYINSKQYKELQTKYNIYIKTTFTETAKKQYTSISESSLDKIMFKYVEDVYKGNISKDTIKNKILEIINE